MWLGRNKVVKKMKKVKNFKIEEDFKVLFYFCAGK